MATQHDGLNYKDIAGQIEAWRERFVSEVRIRKYRRDAGWAMDETAKHSVVTNQRCSSFI